MKRNLILGFIILATALIYSCSNNSKNNDEKELPDGGNETTEDINEILTQLTYNWNEAHTTKNTTYFKSAFAQTVLFYGTTLPADQCTEKKESLFAKYPNFEQTIKGEVTIEKKEDETIKCSFTKAVKVKGEIKEYPSYLVFEKKNGEYKIVAESDLVTDANLAKRKEKQQPHLFIEGLTKGIQATFEEAADGIELKPENSKMPESIKCFFNQTDLDFKVFNADGTKNSLPYRFDIGYESDGEVHAIHKENNYVIGLYDFDKDNMDEIVIALQDNNKEENGLQVNIFKLSDKQWRMYGNLTGKMILGEPKAFIKDGAIKIPRNLRGFYYELTWDGNHFENTSDF